MPPARDRNHHHARRRPVHLGHPHIAAQRVHQNQFLERNPIGHPYGARAQPADGPRMHLQDPRAFVVVAQFRMHRPVPQAERRRGLRGGLDQRRCTPAARARA